MLASRRAVAEEAEGLGEFGGVDGVEFHGGWTPLRKSQRVPVWAPIRLGSRQRG
jgi:hypothetical protein